MDLPSPVGTRLFDREIAEERDITARAVRKRLTPIVESLNGNREQYVEAVIVAGGTKLRYDLALVEAAFGGQGSGVKGRGPAGADSSEFEVRDEAEQASALVDTGACDASNPLTEVSSSTRTSKSELQSFSEKAGNSEALSLSVAQRLLPLWAGEEERRLIPSDRARAWARARRAAIDPVISDEWRRFIGRTLHGLEIGNADSFVAALSRDSGGAAGAIQDWSSIDKSLRFESGDPAAGLGRLSVRTLWRWIGWYRHGRALQVCAVCGGRVDPSSRKCEGVPNPDPRIPNPELGCGQQELPAGLAALQDLERRDRGTIHLHPAHAEHLTSVYLGGDSTSRTSRLALERPRSATECLELLRAEIAAGELPAPAPSIKVLRRWIRDGLPAIVASYARNGRKRALDARGPYIVRDHSEARVNDRRLWDFRRSNARVWFEADGNLYRLFCCAALDEASRDVTLRFDLYPSAALFKSTLRAALLHWGVAREDWMDNGKEFTCEEILGEKRREWRERFDVDDEAKSIFDQFGGEPHYALAYNPTGKALLERFFQTMDAIERELPGWCGEQNNRNTRNYRSFGRPERLKAEEREHKLFCSGELATTPLWRAEDYVAFMTRKIESEYRHRKHSGSGMYLRTPAQAQAAFDKTGGVRRIPKAQELDLLLWYRRRITARGDKVSIQYNRKTLVFRAAELLTLPGDCEVEVHVDPLNVDRAVAITTVGPSRAIALEPCMPTGERSSEELAFELKRKAQLAKAVKAAALAGSRLRRVRSPEESLALAEASARVRSDALARDAGPGRREEISLAPYASARMLVDKKSEVRSQEPEIQVETIDPRYLPDWAKKGL